MKKFIVPAVLCVFWFLPCRISQAASPPIVWLFQISETAIISGDNVKLNWIVIAANTVTIDNGIGDVGLAGTRTVTLDTSGIVTFTLTAANSAGTSRAQVSVEVIAFLKQFGGGWNDEGNGLQTTFDGGFILTGIYRTKSSGGEDIYLIKTDGNGSKLWEKTYGGTSTDKGCAVQQTPDGGYILACESGASNIVKTDASGNMVWTKKYTWPLFSLYCLDQTPDGGFVFGASQGHVIKTDALGNILWDKQYAGADKVYSISLTSDGGYIFTGAAWMSNSLVDEIFLIKTDALGNLVWRRQFGGTTWDRGFAVVEASGGGFILAGTTQQGYGYDVFWLIKTDTAGSTVWDRKFPNSRSECETAAYALLATSDGGAIAAGRYEDWGPDEQDVYAVCVNGGGNTLWSKVIELDGYEVARAIVQTASGGIIVAGTADTEMTAGDDVFLMKIR